jgi:peptidoglycan/xylan/chitin deacetylase (PgdA/CDA1 family)
MFLLLSWLSPVAAQGPAAQGIAVLVYHRFDAEQTGPTTILTRNLIEQLDWLKANGYQIVPLQEVVVMSIEKRAPGASRKAAITVDDGSRSVYTVLFPIIRSRHLPVTLFVYPSIIARTSYGLTWEQLREMQASGLVRVESHTLWHPNFREERKHLDTQAYHALIHRQLSQSRSILERHLSTSIRLLAWPYGIYDKDLEDAAREEGYEAAFAYDGKIATPSESSFAIHRIPVLDFPGLAGFAVLNPLSRSLRGKQ